MSSQNPINIILASENTPRSVTLAEMIRDGFQNTVSVKIVNLSVQNSIDYTDDTDICIVDLLSSHLPVVSFLSGVKQMLPDSKVIALHIYKTHELIEPLYNLGIDGYLHGDPARDELVQAIRVVAEGNLYYPSFLTTDKNT